MRGKFPFSIETVWYCKIQPKPDCFYETRMISKLEAAINYADVPRQVCEVVELKPKVKK